MSEKVLESDVLQSGKNNSKFSMIDVVEEPPLTRRFYADSSALLVTKKGIEMERKMMRDQDGNKEYSFLWSSDPYHAYYQKKLAEYRALKQDGPIDHIKIKASDYGLGGDSPLRVRVPRKIPELPLPIRMGLQPRMMLPPRIRRPPLPPRKYVIILPQGITAKELETIKSTAKSVAQHGTSHVLNLNPHEFMNQGDWRYLYFKKLVAAYLAESLRRDDNPELVASESETAAYEESFQLFFEAKKKLHEGEGAELAVVDSHEMVWTELLVPPKSEGSEKKRQRCFELPEGSVPKRQRCFDEAALVPEDQFLAQHRGFSTIRVLVPSFDDCRTVEITVESLSENVASFKEKIAAEIYIPANRLKLMGYDGLVLRDDKSLAHYNVGHNDFVSLSLSL